MELEYKVICESMDNTFYPIRPRDIRAGLPGSLLSTFGKAEIEEAAERLVLFFQICNCWTSFTLEELRDFYQKNGWDFENPFFGLMGEWFYDIFPWGAWRKPADTFIVCDSAGNHSVTDLFIERCAKAKDPTAFILMAEKVADIITDSLGTKKPTRIN